MVVNISKKYSNPYDIISSQCVNPEIQVDSFIFFSYFYNILFMKLKSRFVFQLDLIDQDRYIRIYRCRYVRQISRKGGKSQSVI